MDNILALTCQHCSMTNRVPVSRMGDNPKCGKCHIGLFTGKPVELDDVLFEKFLSRNQTPLLVDFWASWCGPCIQMAPAFAEASALLEPRIRLAKVNTEKNQNLASRFGVRSLPTMILFDSGEEQARQIGAMNAMSIVKWASSKMPNVA